MMMMMQEAGHAGLVFMQAAWTDLPEEGEQRHGAKPVQVVQQEGLCYLLLSPLAAPLGKQALQQGLDALHISLNVLL